MFTNGDNSRWEVVDGRQRGQRRRLLLYGIGGCRCKLRKVELRKKLRLQLGLCSTKGGLSGPSMFAVVWIVPSSPFEWVASAQTDLVESKERNALSAACKTHFTLPLPIVTNQKLKWSATLTTSCHFDTPPLKTLCHFNHHFPLVTNLEHYCSFFPTTTQN